MSFTDPHGANPLREVIIGAVAGVGAAFVMDRFQALWSQYGDRVGLPAPKSDDEPSTNKAADLVVQPATGHPVPAEHRETAGQAVHYATGAALGAVYGVIASSIRGSTIGAGLPFGAAAFMVLDEKLVPALRLGSPPTRSGEDVKRYAIVSHLVFGFALDSLRRGLGAR